MSQLTTIGWRRQKPGIPGRLPAGFGGFVSVAPGDVVPAALPPPASSSLLCLAFFARWRSSRRRYGSSLDGGRELSLVSVALAVVFLMAAEVLGRRLRARVGR